MVDYNDTLNTISSQLEATTDEVEIARLNDQKTTVLNQISQARSTIAQFQATVSSIQSRTNALTIVQRADIPTGSSARSSLTPTLLGAAVGLVLAMGVILVIEYLDDRIKTPEIATKLLHLQILGAIPKFNSTKGDHEELVSQLQSMSPVVESYRHLRTNIALSKAGTHKPVFIITSANPQEGKSLTTANLAVTVANAGLQVLLIDADLRRPRIHEIFGLTNEVGLSTLLAADAETPKDSANDAEAANGWFSQLSDCLRPTAFPKLRVITTGFTPVNPTEVLSSALMKRWIDAFRAAANIDVILIDTPPALLFADTSALASAIDADVLMVIDAASTRKTAALATKQQLEELDIPIRGVILNRINPRDQAGYYPYSYGYYSYTSPLNGDGTQKRRRIAFPFPWRREQN